LVADGVTILAHEAKYNTNIIYIYMHAYMHACIYIYIFFPSGQMHVVLVLLSLVASWVKTANTRESIINAGESRIVAWYSIGMNTGAHTARAGTQVTHTSRHKATRSIKRSRTALRRRLSWQIIAIKMWDGIPSPKLNITFRQISCISDLRLQHRNWRI
jgi:hypothetical protein